MRNEHLWAPSKFVRTPNGLRASPDPGQVGVGSRLIVDRVAEVYSRAIEAHARGRLLDLGCGKVPLYAVYKDRVADVVCVDWSGTLHKSPFLDHELDLNQPLDLPDSQFDTILLTDVLEHVANPELLWREVSRVLRPGGTIIVGVPFFYWIHEAPHDYYRYTEHRLRLFCEVNALEVVSLDSYGGALDIILDILAKTIADYRMLSAIHLFFSRAITNSALGRKVSRRTSQAFPWGYCLVARKRVSS